VRSSKPLGYIVVLTIALSCQSSSAVGAEPELGGDYLKRDKGNETLVVFVAGLAGERTWKPLVRLIDSDNDLSSIDYLVYHSPDSLDIDGNVSRLETILRDMQDKGSKHANEVYVGHSIGGTIIKQSLLRVIAQANQLNVPKLVITYGTPLDSDNFNISSWESLGARVLRGPLPPLRKEALNIDRLKKINEAWRTAVKTAPLSEVRLVNVFGVGDRTAPIEKESRSNVSVFIDGDHISIASPTKSDDCSFVIFKAMVKNWTAVLNKIPCILK